jgi:excisionase family DNA binding protein
LSSAAESTPLSVRVSEAMRLLGIGHSYIYRLMAAGRLPYRQNGRIRMIDYEALVAFRDLLPIAEPKPPKPPLPSGPLLLLDEQQLAVDQSEPEPIESALATRPESSKAEAVFEPAVSALESEDFDL